MASQSKRSPLLRFGGGLSDKDLSKVRDNVSAIVLRGGPVFIYRWKNGLDVQGESLTSRDKLLRVLAVPFADGHDHAEGFTIVSREPLSVLVSYDSPQSSRTDGADGVRLDLFDVA